MNIDNMLQDGEVVVWHAPAPRGLLLRRIDLLLIPLSLGNILVATLFSAVLWFAEDKNPGAITGNAGRWMAIFIALMIILYALYTVIARFFVDMCLRSRRWYVLTDRRALVVDRFPWARWREIHLHGHVEVSVRGRSVRLGPNQRGPRTTAARWKRVFQAWIGPPHPFVFEHIDDVDRVRDLVAEVQGRR